MARVKQVSMGTGSSTSARDGANEVANLATKLHAPNAVAEKSVGNTSALAMYKETKLLASPNLAMSTKTGNAEVSAKLRIRIEPADVRVI
eukprot:CAMPEP_0176399552 /NCGR_PEP_ID=MMETSP0126-20121128/46856_1 /TAXON_ID=141414 ORGANISM="Strombidinopsis acuminatum, Strain SPMC142" /NCGR_SAMPLE_ID=MMETSP0126 /ASSEMBLY_ACC=CAM_ASM_000229 /LENGTH=89 /DNA_ID=CAMNT_0017775211 /DNA_START=155 /DNA_END=424 /DNA_ORIENTATION=+